jgi:hypothetical protein
MGALLRGWRAFYGDHPLHLLTMIGCFALVGYVVSLVYTDPSAIWLLVWFAGAVIAHDLILYPLYALADQPLTISRWARRKYLPGRAPLVPAINHIRVPVLGSGVLFLIYLPTITGRGESALRFAAGLSTAGIFDHWLLITGILFLGSAVIYAVRMGVAARRRHKETGSPPTSSEAGDGAAEPAPAPAPSAEGATSTSAFVSRSALLVGAVLLSAVLGRT